MKKKPGKKKLAELKVRLMDHLRVIYPERNNDLVVDAIMNIMQFSDGMAPVRYHTNLWDETHITMVTYGNSVTSENELPLTTLHGFLNQYIQDTCNTVHILPFFPYSSDDGFAVINYCEVNQSLGSWKHINALAEDYTVMADLVINHCSSRSIWFDNFKQGKVPGAGYFIECDPDVDLSKVVRPRTSPLLRETETFEGSKYVWCTFSHDQVDVNFQNPDVLIEFVKIIKQYLDNGISIFRLDAVAFLWKTLGTNCINLPETHEVIRLLRLIIEHYNASAILITETNIPNRENLSYFGNANEAHLVYNFTLPPLILYTLLSGKSRFLKQWMMSMPPAQNGTTYFNFIASHDGIGLRPVEGILSEAEVEKMVSSVKRFGGDVSWRSGADGQPRPYELNISLIDAMRGSFEGEDQYQIPRYICAHAIMLALEGIPAFYIHSLLATENDHTKVEMTSNKRAINRHVWELDELKARLEDAGSLSHQVFNALKRIIDIRKRQKAFHPNATQFTLHFEESVFAFWRQSMDRAQSIFCIYNISNRSRYLRLQDINLIELDQWQDLVTGKVFQDLRERVKLKPYEFLWISNK